MRIEIFTDASFDEYKNIFGYAFHIRINEQEKIFSGSGICKSSEEAEAISILESLKYLSDDRFILRNFKCILICTDAKAIVQKINRRPRKGLFLAIENKLLSLKKKLNIEKIVVAHCKAHAGHRRNELCDEKSRGERINYAKSGIY